ncbi:hypothetical protein M231_05808 [Tremella mesenterica]|uniref:Uncharacterized protein n=1 Tax=Tremella mesenterica TaxID=5217 RepID=A0A4Q1BH41_TREME|nr:hypothetical protein M231_05808 [Tremella mesenterica]
MDDTLRRREDNGGDDGESVSDEAVNLVQQHAYIGATCGIVALGLIWFGIYKWRKRRGNKKAKVLAGEKAQEEVRNLEHKRRLDFEVRKQRADLLRNLMMGPEGTEGKIPT